MYRRRIGVVIATREELDAFIYQMKPVMGDPACITKGEFELFIWDIFDEWGLFDFQPIIVIAAHSHFGEISAAANTQLLISEYGAEIIINYGVAGSMVDSICVGDVLVVERIFHYDFNLYDTDHHYPRGYYPSYRTAYLEPSKELLSIAQSVIPNLQRVTCMSSDSFIGASRKHQLAIESKAHICEMECAAIYLTCRKNNIPCLILKSISDAIDEDAEAFNDNVEAVAATCANVLVQILTHL